MPIGPARMPLFDHIGELRRRLTIIVVSLLVCAIVGRPRRGSCKIAGGRRTVRRHQACKEKGPHETSTCQSMTQAVCSPEVTP